MAKKLETVLIATSLIDGSTTTTRLGGQVARAAGARVALIHSVMFPAWFDQAPLAYMGDQGEVLRANVEALRQDIAEEARQAGIEGDELLGCFLEHGPPHRTVVETAHRLKADLIILGALDRPAHRRHALGSTTQRVVQKATRPVLVVREGLTLPLRRCLVPVDLSALSGDALSCGLGRILAICGDRLPEVEVLFVVPSMEREGWPHFTSQQVDRFAHQELDRFLAEHAAEWPKPMAAKLRTGEAKEGIAEEMEAWKPDLVVIGTHGRSGFERFVMGSVASDVLRRSPVSVLVVPPEAAARAALEVEEAARREPGWAPAAGQDRPVRLAKPS